MPDQSVTSVRYSPDLSVVFNECDSTQEAARRLWPNHPAAASIMVRARTQFRGQGRSGRSWQTPEAGGLLVTFGWRGELDMRVLEDLPTRVGRILKDSLTIDGYVEDKQVIWKAPNDLLCADSGEKLAGILIDTVTHAQEVKQVMIGIGVNVYGERFTLDCGRQVSTLQALNPELSAGRLRSLSYALFSRCAALMHKP